MIVVGIDEAGRGPVFGSLFIGYCVYEVKDKKEITKIDSFLETIGAYDSKILSSKKRNEILQKVSSNKKIKLLFDKISPKEIDNCNNLNELELKYIAGFLSNLKPNCVFIDAFSSNPKGFEEKLKSKLNFNCKIVAENKADNKYRIVSLASIFAKEKREEEVLQIKKTGFDIGSGYTSDPTSQKFLRENFKDEKLKKHIRKSWQTYKKLNNKTIFDF